MRALVVEDESRLARNIAQVLREEGSFAVDVSLDGEDARHMATTNPYDLVVLDLMLPKVDGLEVLKAIRSKGIRSPVLVLTARDGVEEVVRGLDAGCDDYLTKPFDMTELLARCRALVRRAYDRPDPIIAVGELQVNTAARQVTWQGRAVLLQAMEYRVLEYLALRAGQVVSKTDLIEHLYDFNSERVSNVVEVYISFLRRRLDPGPEHKLIHTIRGQGYMLGDLPR